MDESKFQEIWRYLTALNDRLEKIECLIGILPCLCREDFTDGTALCQQCGRERTHIGAR